MRAFERAMHAAAVILRREPWWAEFWSAAVAILWGGASWLSEAELRDWPSMRVLTQIGGDEFWQMVAFGLGTAQLLALLLNARWVRWGVALAMCWFWAVLTLGVWDALHWAPPVALYAGYCGANVYSILRLLRAIAPVPARP